ncbi:MAG: type I-E CRISPR-associated protein Cse1/CasA [Deltaproteobacteria bacterium]|nr:type I-E CRISPR-associated protein Cse1/CasA [Deltaproteobacteria bacterium]
MATPDRCRFNLLDEPLLHWRDGARVRHAATMPGLLAALGAGDVVDFPKVRAHQYHPWCMFLAQLAALALQKAGKTDVKQVEGAWRDLIIGLTDGAVEPWCLVVDDLTKPAFLQPPVLEGSLTGFEQKLTPDELDMLVSAKGHDLKEGTVAPGEIEAWVLALMTLQTMQGYSGSRLYGIARMNGGSANRPRVAMAPGPSPSDFFVRDVRVMLAGFDDLARQARMAMMGTRLLWLEPWDGEHSSNLSECAPHFLEVCRRVRVAWDGGLVVRFTPTAAKRLDANAAKGNVGDPWIPVARKDGKALCIAYKGFTYQMTSALLWGSDWVPSAAATVQPWDAPEMIWLGAALTRGDGRTEGLHERRIRLDARKRRLFAEQRESLSETANKRIKLVDLVSKDVLRPALKALACGGSVPDTYYQGLDRAVDPIFFEALWQEFELPERERNVAWQKRLYHLAEAILDAAEHGMPIPDARRLRAAAKARGVFESRAQAKLKDYFAEREKRNSAFEEVHP